MRRPILFVMIACIAVLGSRVNASTLYTDGSLFTAAVGPSLTDDYENPGYSFVQTDAAMTAVLNETRYQATAIPNNDIVEGSPGNHNYCAGCNGSFLLTFTQTTIGDANGVFGVGLDIVFNNGSPQYDAFVTLGNGSTADYLLPLGSSFFGITDPLEIKSIAFGLPGGGTTVNGGFAIDNLTISAPLPEPATWPVLALGVGVVVVLHRRRASA